jgi:hypothetical protein
LSSSAKKRASARTRDQRVVSGIHQWLDRLMPRPWWRAGLALLNGLLVFAATSGGLFIVAPTAQSAVLGGIAVGLVAPSVLLAGLVGALAGLLGVLLRPENFFNFYWAAHQLPQLLTVLGAVLIAGASAAAVSFVVRRSGRASFAFLALGFMLIVTNLWFTTLTITSQPLEYNERIPFNTQIAEGRMPQYRLYSDATLFYDVYKKVDGGGAFYPEYANALKEQGRPIGYVGHFRTPLLVWFWSALPTPQSVVIAFLVLVTAAIAATIPLGMRSVRLPLILPAGAALAAYYLFYSTNLELFQQEGWAGALGVVSLGLFAASLRSPRWRAWTVAAVACAVLSVLCRETMAFLLLGGLTSTLLADRERKRFQITAWSVGFLVFTLLYALHAWQVNPYLMPAVGVTHAGRGGVAFMMSALNWATEFLGYQGWLPITLTLMGIIGSFVIRKPELRVLVLIAVFGPWLASLFLGNDAWVPAGVTVTEFVNYWGASFVPLLYAVAPAALALVPSAESSG